jgi:sulfotransferase family protein
VAAEPTTGPPDFIGVGTQRSGTTWWFQTLLGHPQIRPPRGRRKELHFFDRFCAQELTDADVAAYHELFPRRPGQIAGEWTPRYMHDFWTPKLLARAAPEAQLLIMFRDPIERFRSGVPHRLSRTPDARIKAATADAIERGRYATQLRRVLAYHDESRILILQYEKCVADPAGQYRRTLRFLGVDADHEHDAFERRRGTTQAAKKKPLWTDLLEGMTATMEPEVRALAAMTPEIDVSLWKNFAHLAAGHAVSA